MLDNGSTLLYSSDVQGSYTLMWASVASQESHELMDAFSWITAHSLSPDGRQLIYVRQSDRTKGDDDIWVVPFEAGSPPTLDTSAATPVRDTEAHEPFPVLSPDGNWIAYSSNETGRWEIFLAPFPSMEGPRQISTTGGEEARWNPDGTEVIYRWGSQWYSVPVTLEPEPEYGDSTLLFEGPFINVAWYSWAMTPDAQRFLVIEGPDHDKPVTELVVLANFGDELERLVPTGGSQ